MRGGWSLDISIRDPGTGSSFDLRSSKDQEEVKIMNKRDCPTVLVVSPPCTAFAIANHGEIAPQVLAGAVEMIRFSMDICNLQHKAGRQFIFEQPQSSRAWYLESVTEMTSREGVLKSTLHQCMYGMETRDELGSDPAYKPTSVLPNHNALADVLHCL